MASSEDMSENSDNKPKRFHWKGRYVSESVFNQRKSQSGAAKKRKLSSEEPADPGEQPTYVVDGHRIVDLTVRASFSRLTADAALPCCQGAIWFRIIFSTFYLIFLMISLLFHL